MWFRHALIPTLLLSGLAHTAEVTSDPHAGHNHGPGGHDDHASNGIAVPDTVQKNLGITWATASYRVVQGVIRMPGRCEAEPDARRTYQAPLTGRVERLVQPYQRVKAGDPLFRIVSNDWHRMQLNLAEGCADGCADGCGTAALAQQRLAAGEAQANAVRQALTAWRERLAVLERLEREIGGKAAERSEAATRVAELALQDSEATARVARLRRDARGPDGTADSGLAALRFRQMLAEAAAITGLSAEELLATDSQGRPHWMTISAPTVRAVRAGVVEDGVPSDGAWITAQSAVLTVTDPTGVRMRAAGLQADLGRLRDGLPARIIASDPALGGEVSASVVLGPLADATDRSLALIARPASDTTLPTWMRPGVTANVDVVVSGTAEEELAIPVAATIRDGLKTVIFRRDPAHPDQVQKIDADLGASDGRWVVVQSGLKEGDQVVLGGIYPLMLSQQGGGVQAGHFEADGTFHVGSH